MVETTALTTEVERLLSIVQEQAHKLEAANYRLGYLEAQADSYKDQIRLLTDSQHKRTWWQWFIGKKSV